LKDEKDVLQVTRARADLLKVGRQEIAQGRWFYDYSLREINQELSAIKKLASELEELVED